MLAALEPGQHVDSFCVVTRFPEHLAVEYDGGIGTEHNGVVGNIGLGSLEIRQPQHHRTRFLTT
jgi:hypothetical protein